MKGFGGRRVLRTLRGLVCCCGVLCLTAGLAYGQATVGSIVGNITDTAGETVPSVEITVTNQETGALRHTAADTQGAYSVTNLEPKVDHPTINQWFNPKAFAVPQPGTFGNAAYGSIEGPGTQGLNVALFKAFTIKGENRLRLQVSATNALNHPNFAGPRNVLLGARYNF